MRNSSDVCEALTDKLLKGAIQEPRGNMCLSLYARKTYTVFTLVFSGWYVDVDVACWSQNLIISPVSLFRIYEVG